MNRFDDRIFVIDKDAGPTSFDIVSQMRRVSGLRRVGHAGTLDPLATGVLLLCTGRATRAVEHLMNLEKEYSFDIVLGIETDTLDIEGQVVAEKACPLDVPASDLEAVARSFVGEYEMEPPQYSAIKRNGKRLYQLARDGEDPEPPARRVVTIHDVNILAVDLPRVRVSIRCSRGTYVRSLARDFGRRLDLPAHVQELSRDRVGPFSREQAFPASRLRDGDVADIASVEVDDALGFLPGVVVAREAEAQLLNGVLPSNSDVMETIGDVAGAGSVRILGADRSLLAVGRRNKNAHERNLLTIVDSFRLFVESPGVTAARHNG